MTENALVPAAHDLPQISVYLEPTKRKLTIELDGTATVGDVVKGMVTQLRDCEAETGFKVDTYLREKIGEGYSPEWQLFREDANMTLLPPGAMFRDLTPPLAPDEMFTLKVNAKVAGDKENVRLLVQYLPDGKLNAWFGLEEETLLAKKEGWWAFDADPKDTNYRIDVISGNTLCLSLTAQDLEQAQADAKRWIAQQLQLLEAYVDGSAWRSQIRVLGVSCGKLKFSI